MAWADFTMSLWSGCIKGWKEEESIPKGRKPEKTKPGDFFRTRYGKRYYGIAFAREMQTARDVASGVRIRFRINATTSYIYRHGKKMCSIVITCDELKQDRHEAMMKYVLETIKAKEKDELLELPGE